MPSQGRPSHIALTCAPPYLAGETAANIPLLFSRYELDLVLRTASHSPFDPITLGAIPHTANTSSTPDGGMAPAAGSRGVSYDLLSYERYQPQAAAMYGAALLTLPRLTLVAAWLWDQPVYDMVRDSKVDYKVGSPCGHTTLGHAAC